MISRVLFVLAFLFLVSSPAVLAAQEQFEDDNGSRACVTLLKYKHRDCKGDPIEVRNNTVWQTPGSPCKHTTRMGDNSVTNQYCSQLDTKAPEFHQKVYVKNKSCHVKWYQKAYSPMKLTYNQKDCTYGYKIANCVPGECENPSPPLLEMDMDLSGIGAEEDASFTEQKE